MKVKLFLTDKKRKPKRNAEFLEFLSVPLQFFCDCVSSFVIVLALLVVRRGDVCA